MKPNWEDNISVKKGTLGERIGSAYMEGQGYVVYIPEKGKAHPFDRLAVKDKRVFVVAEIKAKARLRYYEGTGFNKSNYDDYCLVRKEHNMGVFIFFVDEELGTVYGNFLDELERPQTDTNGNSYPLELVDNRTGQPLIIFSLKNMIHIKDLTVEEKAELKKLTRSNYY